MEVVNYQSQERKEKGVLCEICDTWYHIKCNSVTGDTYKYLQRPLSIDWYCKGFDKLVAKVQTAIIIMLKKEDKLADKVQGVT